MGFGGAALSTDARTTCDVGGWRFGTTTAGTDSCTLGSVDGATEDTFPESLGSFSGVVGTDGAAGLGGRGGGSSSVFSVEIWGLGASTLCNSWFN